MLASYLFIRYFGISLLLLVLFYLAGKFLLPTKERSFFYDAFLRILLSSLLFSSLFALFQTRLLSIQILFIPWLVFLFLEEKKEPITSPLESPKSDYKKWSALIGVALLIFTWNFLGRVSSGPFPFVIPLGTALAPNDIHIYSLRSYYLAQSGWENYFGVYNTFDEHFQGLNPYHYLELWFSSGITTLFKGLNILNLSLITTSIFHFISFLGILAIAERFLKIRWYHILIASSLLFAGGLYLFYAQLGFPPFGLSILTYRFKMIVYAPLILGFILSCLQQEKTKSVLFLLALPISTFTSMPAILGYLCLLLVFGRMFRWLQYEEWKKIGFYSLVLIGGFALFYLLSPSPTTHSTFAVESSEISQMLSLDQLGQKLFKIVGSFIYIIVHWLVLYWIYALLFFFFKIELSTFKSLFIQSMLLIISAATSYAILADLAQATQLFYNVSFTLSNVLGILIIILSFSKFEVVKWYKKAFLLLVCLSLFSTQAHLLSKRHLKPRQEQHYSTAYLVDIQTYIQSGKASPMGAAIKGATDYDSDFSKMTAGYILGYYLQYIKDGYTTVSISDFDIPINPNNQRNNQKDIQSGAFYQFVSRQKKTGSFQSISSSQQAFIKKNGINFIILTANAKLPTIFEADIQQILKDPVSGEQFIILNP